MNTTASHRELLNRFDHWPTRDFLLFLAFFASLLLLHLPLLRLPYFWDEAGYYIPAARDILLDHSLVPHSTMSNAHPPLLLVYIAAAWKLFSYSPLVTRTAILMVTAFALLGVYRLARQVANPPVAIASVISTGLFPVFFAQSSLAHLDLATGALIIWGLSFYLLGRRISAAAFFCLATLTKETAAIVPVSLFFWEVLLAINRRICSRPKKTSATVVNRSSSIVNLLAELDLHAKPSLALLASLLPLVGWFLYHYHRTGFVFGNPDFLQYNLTATLNPLRFVAASSIRLWHLFGYMNMFVLTLATILAMRLPARLDSESARRKARGNGEPELLRRRIPLPVQGVFAVLILAHVVALSVLGGAVLARYLLPVYPLVVITCVSTLRRRLPWWPAFVAIVCFGFAIALLVNPPYRFAPEDNLAYADYVRLHRAADEYVAQHFPNRRVLTAWPASDELRYPWLGYVPHPVPTLRIENFSAGEMILAAQARGQYRAVLLFSTKYDPPRFLLKLPFWEALQTRFFGYHRDLTPAQAAKLLGARIVFQRELHGQWVAVLETQTVENV